MLRDKNRELGLFQKVKRGSRRVLTQRRHSAHLQEIVLCLHVAQIAVCHGSERDFSVYRSIGKAEQKHAAVVRKNIGFLKSLSSSGERVYRATALLLIASRTDRGRPT